jgi:hypothetical protein
VHTLDIATHLNRRCSGRGLFITDINTGTLLGGLASLCVEDEAGALVRVLDKRDA